MIDYAKDLDFPHRLPMEPTTAPAPFPEVSVRTMAARLGMPSFKTLLRRVRKGQVPGVQWGKNTADGWFVDPAAVMAAATVPAPAPETPVARWPGVSSARQPKRATTKGRMAGRVMSTRDMANAAAQTRVGHYRRALPHSPPRRGAAAVA